MNKKEFVTKEQIEKYSKDMKRTINGYKPTDKLDTNNPPIGIDPYGEENWNNEPEYTTNTAKHAIKELNILFDQHPDSLIKEFENEILALCEKFGNSGQSGGSATYTANALANTIKKLCLFETLSVLTGDEDEWNEVSDGLFQNNRNSAVFKKNDHAYYLDAIVFKGDTWNSDHTSNDWDTFTGTVEGITSRQYIKSFPFSPKRFYIDVTREKYEKEKHGDNARVITTGLDGDVVYFIKDKNQLEEVFNYYQIFD
jgi:hypothetical protein